MIASLDFKKVLLLNALCLKIVRHTLKILQNLLQDFQSVSDLFGILCVKGLKLKLALVNHDYCRKINDR